VRRTRIPYEISNKNCEGKNRGMCQKEIGENGEVGDKIGVVSLVMTVVIYGVKKKKKKEREREREREREKEREKTDNK